MQPSQDLSHDDSDMAKLKKSLKQQRQESLRKHNTVTKLTPAEIRSLNNSVASRHRNGSSSSGSYHADRATPPRTPETTQPRQLSISGRNSVSLPTPPQSPDNSAPRRENSVSRNATQIHSPIPQSHSKAGFVLANGNGSRPPSAASQRGMPTYRGPEMTRTGSYSMLHSSKLTHQIVDNPLSQFSRPRQSRTSVSPAGQHRPQRSNEGTVGSSHRSQSLPTLSISPEGVISSSVADDSLVSAVADDAYKTTDADNVTSVINARVVDQSEPSALIGSDLVKSQTTAVDGSHTIEPHSKFSWKWRKNSSSHLDGNEKVEPRKLRRRTISGSKTSSENVRAVAYENTKPGVAPEERDSLKGDLPSSRTSVYIDGKGDPLKAVGSFATHPAVRPLGDELESRPELQEKGKQREQDEGRGHLHDVLADDSIPMYSRCSCCGKLKKPIGNRSLSPVLENENLRTNFSMEMDRTDNEEIRRKRSGSLGRRPKSTPIIPMVLPQGSTVQARIAPKEIEIVQPPPEPIPMVNLCGDIIARGAEPISLVPLKLEESNKKIVRFSSLYLPGEVRKPTYVDLMAPVKENDDVASKAVNDEVGNSVSVETNSRFQHQRNNHRVSSSTSNGTIYDRGLTTPTLEEATGELMAALNGVDMPFNHVHRTSEEFAGKDATNHMKNSSSAFKATDPVERHFVPGTALTTDEAVVQTPPVSVSIMSKPAPRLVSVKPKTPDPQGTTANRNRKQRSGHETKYTYHNGQIIAYSDHTSKDFVTKPKATAQFMAHESNNAKLEDARNATSLADSASRKKTAPDSIQRSDNPRRTKEPMHYNISTYRGLQSSKFEPLPEPQFGKHFGESSGTFRSYILPPGKYRSNLVESVLAATNADHDHDHYPNIVGR